MDLSELGQQETRARQFEKSFNTSSLGPVGAWGTGLIPGDSISRIVRGTGGVADTVEIVYVRHVSGADSTLIFKSYDQRREAFQGTEQDVIWLDEEPLARYLYRMPAPHHDQ